MKPPIPLVGAAGLLLIATFTGCASDSAYYRDRPIGYDDRSTAVYEDDYDYYPGHEIYYARNRREFIYRDGDRWVRTTEPRVSSRVLLSSPSVRVEFRDWPGNHHNSVTNRYPRNWRYNRDRDGRRDWRDENQNGISDYDEYERNRYRR